MANQDKKNQNKIVKVMDVVSQSVILRKEPENQEKLDKKSSKFSFSRLFKKDKKEKTEISDIKSKNIKIEKTSVKITEPTRNNFSSRKFDVLSEARSDDEAVLKEDSERGATKSQPKQQIYSRKDYRASVLINDFFKPGEYKKPQKNEVIGKIEKKEPFEQFKKIMKADKEKPKKAEEENDEDFLEEEIGSVKDGSRFGKLKKYFLACLFLAFAGFGLYAAIFILPKAEIKIIAKKTVWNFNETIFASKNAVGVDLAEKRIPATFFSETKNISLTYAASGKKNVVKYASGEIIIYNSFSSDVQNLVKGTRFETPDGKIFRLENSLIVPGAKIIDGKIVPSNVKTRVAANEAGIDYNIAPVEKFTIPGFKDSEKYNGFYAKSENAMAGGFVGEVPYPTESDIKTAREKTEAALKENLNSLIISQISSFFKIIDSGRKFGIIREDIGKEADKEGKFSVFMEGEMTLAAFKEDDVLKLMAMLAKQVLGESFEVKNFDVSYGVGQIDSKDGIFSFILNYNGNFWQPVDIEKFKIDILGKKELELKTRVFSIPGVEKTTVSFWPFWVKNVPKNINRIKVAVE
ncbi:hypothetical protein HZB04_03050 [Candidatus Wolfebacteria bacterium]|nr:hypothetical protein [Candidatus Wolfebacteria bacterium]